MAREDTMPGWARWLTAIVATALVALVAIVIGGLELGDGVPGILETEDDELEDDVAEDE